jgi:hypothetical protein
MMANVSVVLNWSTPLPLMPRNWAWKTRDFAHSPPLPNETSPTMVLNVVLRR